MKSKNYILLSIFGIATVLLLIFDYKNFIFSYYLSYQFFLLISASALFLEFLFSTLNSHWQKKIESILQSFSRLIPYFIPAYLVIFLDNISIHLLINISTKNAFLEIYCNTIFVSIRHFTVLLLLSAITLNNRSKKRFFLKHSGLSLILITVAIVILGIDFSLLLSDKWFSSVWSILFLSSGVLLANSLWILNITKVITKIDEEEKIILSHNLGKILFTFVMLWGYFFFIQYLIVTYAGIGEELSFYISRLNGIWEIVFYSFIILSFVIPFITLLFKRIKQDLSYLKIISIIIIFGQILHFYWLLFPQIYSSISFFLFSLVVFVFFLLTFYTGKKIFREKYSSLKENEV